MEKLGIERRLYTSGENKAMLDPFLPEKPGGRRKAEGGAAGNSRGLHRPGASRAVARRLKGPEKTLFSGEYWTGETAIELGLADGIGDMRTTLRERFGDNVLTPLMSPARSWFGRAQPGVSALIACCAAGISPRT